MDFDPEGTRLPIKIDTATNAEYEPRPLGALERAANRLAHVRVDQTARATGKTRREFLAIVSAHGGRPG